MEKSQYEIWEDVFGKLKEGGELCKQASDKFLQAVQIWDRLKDEAETGTIDSIDSRFDDLNKIMHEASKYYERAGPIWLYLASLLSGKDPTQDN